jgi:hypothetical protein
VISRLYDMEPNRPNQYEASMTDPLLPDDDFGNVNYEQNENVAAQ